MLHGTNLIRSAAGNLAICYAVCGYDSSNSLHVRVTELVQDVVSVLLLPLYFAVSGLKTDVTLLDNAAIWGVCLLTICAACFGEHRELARSDMKGNMRPPIFSFIPSSTLKWLRNSGLRPQHGG